MRIQFYLRNICLLVAVLLFGITPMVAQKGNFRYYTQLNAIAAYGDYAPYWFTANNQAISSVNNASGYARYGMSYDNTFGKKGNFRYNITADILANYNNNSTISFQQAYGELSWKWLTLSIGCKERWGEQEHLIRKAMGEATSFNKVGQYYPHLFNDRFSNLGSGGLIFSGNGRPIPQVRIEIPEFVNVPGTKEWLKVRAYISYGFFTDGKYQQEFTNINPKVKYGRNILYHGKGGFINIGKPSRFPITFDGGLEMHTQFGGEMYNTVYGTVKMPAKFTDYVKAFIPMSGGEDTPMDEQANISGNQIGCWHAAFTIHTKPLEIRIYGEHMFEDFSQLFFFEYQMNNKGEKRTLIYPWRDMLVGINIANKSKILPFISNIRYEFLTTRDQSGALYHDPSEFFYDQMDGCDNYLNHGIYPGWHHWGMSIGTPLIISPAYNKNGSLVFRSNRLIAHNIGINGIIKTKIPFAYKLNYTYSENWGTYANPFQEKRYTTSVLAEITCMPKDTQWLGTVSFGYDKSNFIGKNIGLMFTITHVGSFFK